MEQTKNLNLNRWVPEDFVRLTQINQNFDKIDEEVGTLKMEHLALGTYTGDGADSRTIELPFSPKLAILMGYINNNGTLTLLTPTANFYVSSESSGSNTVFNVKLVGSSLIIQNANWNNGSGKTFHYIVVR